ncbi:MAG: MarR family transcriptional regulator [Candidatus Omnitrophica bacterium]|nr:MarR family transcriptional regulator [Candidatus Omnitrophota bacterium]
MAHMPLSEFADKLCRLMPGITRGMIRREANELASGHITLPQFFILNMLQCRNESRMTDIARALGVTTAAATGIVGRLVKSGYTQRVYDEKDRRVIKIRLQPKGGDLANKLNKQKKQNVIDIFGKVSEEERANFLKTITRIGEILMHEQEAGK